MSAERLREAAALMRERADAADALGKIADTITTSSCDEFAEHIASWHPAVALAVADLLDLAAGHEKCAGDDAGQGYTDEGYGYVDPSCSTCGTPHEYAEPWPCAYATRGLAVANAYLGSDS